MCVTASVSIVKTKHNPVKTKQDIMYRLKPVRSSPFQHTSYTPGKIKMKKALMPPMTLMTSLMSGTYMAMRSVTLIQITVRMTLQRLSKDLVTTPLRFLWRRTTRFRMTDLTPTGTQSQHARTTPTGGDQLWRPSPPQKKNDGINGDDRNAKKQSGNDDDHVASWVGH